MDLLIKDIERDGDSGIGKPEHLKYECRDRRSRFRFMIQ
ncbi:MAG: type II toxin-antitoxin system YoeB family toxin [Clostridiales Family XIII bacterium]|nr:type II toxin-antitoxin system YoeB family toxin [Clostridiales Family XIII bacterium]